MKAPLDMQETQETVSYRTGRRWDKDNGSTKLEEPAEPMSFDTGHEFSMHKKSVHCQRGFNFGEVKAGPWSIDIQAPITIRRPGTSLLNHYPVIAPLTPDEVKRFGTQMIKQAIPTSPSVSLTRFVGELKKDGLPVLPLLSMQGTRKSSDRNPNQILDKANLQTVGGEYLNLVFGWQPVVSDLMGLMETVMSASTILEQYRRDSGKIVRRRISWPVQVSSSNQTLETSTGESLFFGYANHSEIANPGLGRRQVEETMRTTQRIWFSGAFTYYLDLGDGILSRLKRYEQYANKLLGTRLTASTAYDLTPFSWLVDWFGEIGDILSNAESLSSDGLVIRHGYLMRHTRSDRYLCTVPPPGTPWSGRPFYTNYRSERKERVRASPFGFGLNQSGFTGQQWAILAALGMSRSPNKWT